MISNNYYIINAVLLVGPYYNIPAEKFCMICVEDRFIQQYRVITVSKKNFKKNISLARIKKMTREITQHSLFPINESKGDIVEYIIYQYYCRSLPHPSRIEYIIRNIR